MRNMNILGKFTIDQDTAAGYAAERRSSRDRFNADLHKKAGIEKSRKYQEAKEIHKQAR